MCPYHLRVSLRQTETVPLPRHLLQLPTLAIPGQFDPVLLTVSRGTHNEKLMPMSDLCPLCLLTMCASTNPNGVVSSPPPAPENHASSKLSSGEQLSPVLLTLVYLSINRA